jgi:hypothetical protein
MIKIQNTQTGVWYALYSIRFHAAGDHIKGFLDATGCQTLPPDGYYTLPDFNDTTIQLKSYREMMKNLGIDYNQDTTLEFFIVLPPSNQS